MIKGVIFDLDGTTINSLNDIYNSVNIAISDFGYEKKSKDIVRRYMGNGFRKLVKGLLPDDVDDKTIDKITMHYSDIYGQHYMDETFAYDGIYELMLSLQDMGIKIAANSNKKNEYTENIMHKLFSKIDFVATIGARENIPNKPDPTSALEIVELMNLNKDEVMYIGDSEVDMQTGINAGLKVIACLWGFRNKKDVENYNPVLFANKPSDIYEYIKEINK
ncbi:MAG: HAD family hydrolase [Erysipelotrichaceae bacterium]|nr:HAD family hydrolase [Erysipelotrichaceae bacterium]